MSEEKKEWQTPEKGSGGEKEVLEILKSFSSSLRKIPLYPSTHPMVKDAILKLFLSIDNFCKVYGKFSVDVLEHNMMICEKDFDSGSSIVKEISADFKKISIQGVTFSEGVTDYDLENFLSVLTLKPEDLKAKGGIKAAMDEKGIKCISLNEIKYARVKDEEIVAKKEDLGKGEEGPGAEGGGEGEKSRDIVGMVSDFLNGSSDVVPDKDVLMYECKKHSRRLIKQLLKLVGPETAVEEVLKIIEERFQKAGFTDEEKEMVIEKMRQTTIKLKTPKLTKRQLEKQLALLKEENALLKGKMQDFQESLKREVLKANETLLQENAKIKKEKHRINSVLRHVAEGLVIVDKEGKVLLLNPAAEDLLGVNKENKIGTHILEGLRDEQMVTMSSDRQSEIEIELASPNEATKKTIRASTAVIESEDGETVGVVSVLSDITKQKELERMKNAFVSNVTHDLRAPLISIQKSISLILESQPEGMPDQQRQFLEIANNNAKRLTTLVNDLLDLSKLESGHMPMEYSTVNLKTIVGEVFDMLGAWAESREVKLQADFPDSIAMEADPKLLNQVLTNLVGNAVKFTPEQGEVKISAEDEGKNIRISVIDTGCGIPAESLERIFDKFEQAKSVSNPNNPKGSGLGLAIVKEIVQLHGGKISLKSEVGKGTTFSFTIPKVKEVQDIRD